MQTSLFLPLLLLLWISTSVSHPTSTPTLKKGSLISEDTGAEVNKSLKCKTCIAVVAVAAHVAMLDPTHDSILAFIKTVCEYAASPDVCEGMTHQFQDEAFYLVRHLATKPSKICAVVLPECGDPNDPTGEGWNIEIPPRPEYLPTQPRSSRHKHSRTLRVLQITDIHVDYKYQPGSEADCGDPVCCRGANMKRRRGVNSPAGYWGTAANCDIPYRTMNHMLRHINETQKVDYIMVGGDLIDHYDWQYSKDGTLEVLRNISALFKIHFPSTPIYWALGNHEGNPVNNFAPHSLDVDYWPVKLYAEWAEMNKQWMKDDELESIRYRGSWSTLTKDGLRLISINTGFCITSNFFMYLNQSDPDGTMTWFVKQLQKAELAGESVHILAHIPPGYTDCLEGWSRNYYRIIQRFSSIITGQFFGHDHTDYFTMFYQDMHDINSQPIGVAYVAPSATTFGGVNPAYRIYTVDADHKFEILDHENYYADLAAASEADEPEWKLLYSARDVYKIEDLTPTSWNNVVDDIIANATLTERFFQLAYRTETPACGAACRQRQLCLLRSGHHNDTLYCPNNRLETNRIY